MAKKKQTARRKPATKKKTVRRRPAPAATQALVPVVPGPPPPVIDARVITEGLTLGELGLVELKLTPEEEAILDEEVNPADVQVKPTGQVYLPHTIYTKWFNRAFGRTGWSLVPVGKPATVDRSVVVPYILYIHRQPVAFAQGEQEYFPGNREQTYGDALESTVASGLRRVAKRIGVGLELWSRAFGDWFLENHCVQVECRVNVKKGDKWESEQKKFWRRKDQAPLKGEGQSTRSSSRRRDANEPPPEPPPERRYHDDKGGEQVIAEVAARRLQTLIVNSGRDPVEVHEWLEQRYRVNELEQVKRKDYDRICQAVEAPGPLR